MTKRLYLFALVFSFLQTNAQSSYPILLKNHTLQFNNTLEEGLKIRYSEYEYFQENPGNTIYRLVQFSNLDKISLGDASANFEVLEYIPKNTFLIRIKSLRGAINELKSKGAISAEIMAPEWKLSKRLFQNNIPEWAYTEAKKVKIWLRYFNGIEHADILAKVGKKYTVSDENPSEDLIEVTISPSQIQEVAALPYISYVQEMEDPGTKENYGARSNHRINTMQATYPGAPAYDGSGVIVGHGDDGEIGPHIDYTGRMTQPQATNSTGDHGDHVAGTIFGAGNLDPRGKGMAPGAEIYYQTYPDNLTTVDQNYTNLDVRVTVSSYSNGCNAGYTNFTRQMDQDVIDNPNLIHVFSAGNDGTSNCGYGAGNGWGNITGGHKIAKGVVTVANLSSTDQLASSSSRGPAEDGRIKPDVAGVGTNVYSTTNPNSYTFKTGTSMSCPGVGGVLAVLYEAYRDHNLMADPPGGLLKAILMNTCDDLGNPGPDFRFGYGRVNARRAYQVIEDKSYLSDNIANGGTKTFQITVPPNTAEARIMLYWPDVPASTSAAYALVNDLDFEVEQSGTIYQPWVLDPTPNATSLNNNAVRGTDTLNNIEQVTISNPGSGDLTLTVSGTSLPGANQDFYIVYEFVKDEVVLTYPIGGESFVPGETETIRWDASESTLPFSLEVSTDGGNSWTNLASNIASHLRFYNVNIDPNWFGGDVKLRINRGAQSSETKGTFTVADTPANLAISSACLDSIRLSWDPIPGATAYVVYRLGAKYMDSITISVASFAKIPQNFTQTEWFSVAALTPDSGLGRRALAIEKLPNTLFNCQLDDDLNTVSVLSPTTGYMPDCFNNPSAPVTVRLRNSGKNPIFNFDVSYKLDNNPTVTETITDTIWPNGTLDHTFSGSSVTLNTNTTYNLSVWSNFIQDDNSFNDSISENIYLYAGTSVTLPYSNDFENFINCSTNIDCGGTSCNLNGGWVNPTNTFYDDIDWRTHNGSTASNGTGPNTDHNPGTSNGKYLYLESSGGCDSALATLLSPCIDLTSTTSPIFEFWYHMRGALMGVLSVDIYDGSEWTYNVARFSGNQGNQWNSEQISLLPFVGKTVVVRFRGRTGSGFSSDISLDDINVYENAAAPIANFRKSTGINCIDGVVDFTDISTNIPTSWSWSITPNTYTFVNGTNPNSQNISVQFHAVGTYDVTLTATNANGNDNFVSNSAVIVDPGLPIPVFEDFQGTFAANKWEIQNPDGLAEWSLTQVTGVNGTPTQVAVFDNFNSGAPHENDGLISMNLDLRTATSPMLIFDVAYAPKSASLSDSLFIDVSSDCGFTFTGTSYAKGASDLPTTAPVSNFYIPSGANEWRRDTLDLSPYIGSNVKIRFRNYSLGSNALYIDNFQVVNGSVVAPSAAFTITDSIICIGDSITLTNISGGGVPTTYRWEFGNNATPVFSNSSGPHVVSYNLPGTYTITLTVSNAGGFSQQNFTVTVDDTPNASFSESWMGGLSYQFNDLSTNNPTSWTWDFGDGSATSGLQNPTHTYAAKGTYTISLTVDNHCGTTVLHRNLLVQGIGLEESIGLTDLGLFPNPSKGVFNLSFTSPSSTDLRITVIDLSGKRVKQLEYTSSTGKNRIELNLNQVRNGLYMIRLETQKGIQILRAIKE